MLIPLMLPFHKMAAFFCTFAKLFNKLFAYASQAVEHFGLKFV